MPKMGPENGSPQPIELGAILEPKLIKNEVDKYAEICHSKMRNRVGKQGPKWSPEYDEIAKNDTRNHPEGRSKTGLEKNNDEDKNGCVSRCQKPPKVQ